MVEKKKRPGLGAIHLRCLFQQSQNLTSIRVILNMLIAKASKLTKLIEEEQFSFVKQTKMICRMSRKYLQYRELLLIVRGKQYSGVSLDNYPRMTVFLLDIDFLRSL